MQDILTNEYDLRMGGMNLAIVRHRRVHVTGTANPKKYGNRFYGDGWNTIVESQHLEPGKRIAFTNLGGNCVSLITFARNGLGLGFEDIPRAPVNEALPICRGPLDSKGTYTLFRKYNMNYYQRLRVLLHKFNIFS